MSTIVIFFSSITIDEIKSIDSLEVFNEGLNTYVKDPFDNIMLIKNHGNGDISQMIRLWGESEKFILYQIIRNFQVLFLTDDVYIPIFIKIYKKDDD